MTLGQKLIALRKARGMTQEELSEAIGVTRQTISKWELDTSTPDLDYLCKLCDLFGVTADYLIRPNIEEPETVRAITDTPPVPAEPMSLPNPAPKKEPNPRPAGWVLSGVAIFLFVFGMISLFTDNQMPELFLLGGVAAIFSAELLLIRWKPLFIVMWTAWVLSTCSPVVLTGSIFILFEAPLNWRFIFFALWLFYTGFCIGVTIRMICSYLKKKKSNKS